MATLGCLSSAGMDAAVAELSGVLQVQSKSNSGSEDRGVSSAQVTMCLHNGHLAPIIDAGLSWSLQEHSRGLRRQKRAKDLARREQKA